MKTRMTLPDIPPSPPTGPTSRLTQQNSLDLYQVVRAQLEHEDNLLTNRLSWFLTSQSFLFSAYAIIANGYISTPRATPPITSLSTGSPISADPRHLLLTIIPGISIAVSILTLIAILSGVVALHTLRRFYEASPIRLTLSCLPPVQGYRATRVAGVAPPVLLPLLFLGVWIFLLVRRLF